MHHIAAFYRFSPVADVTALVKRAKKYALRTDIMGTVLIAPEGVNGTMSSREQGTLAEFLGFLADEIAVDAIPAKWSTSEDEPFRRLRVKERQEIVSMGVEGVQPGLRTGHEAEPDEWNWLIADPDTVLIDTRNAYEIAVGSFPGAIDPKTATFRDFPAYVSEQLAGKKDKTIAMFCTGGIRCEKASSYLLDQGFENVVQLKGGVLGYFEKAAQQGVDNKWVGDCFVFDERVAVGKDLNPSGHEMCSVCRYPLSEEDRRDERYVPGTSCVHCYGNRSDTQIASAQERYRQVLLAKDRGFVHLSPNLRTTRPTPAPKHQQVHDEAAQQSKSQKAKIGL